MGSQQAAEFVDVEKPALEFKQRETSAELAETKPATLEFGVSKNSEEGMENAESPPSLTRNYSSMVKMPPEEMVKMPPEEIVSAFMYEIEKKDQEIQELEKQRAESAESPPSILTRTHTDMVKMPPE